MLVAGESGYFGQFWMKHHDVSRNGHNGLWSLRPWRTNLIFGGRLPGARDARSIRSELRHICLWRSDVDSIVGSGRRHAVGVGGPSQGRLAPFCNGTPSGLTDGSSD